MFNVSAFVLLTMIWLAVFFMVLPLGTVPASSPDRVSGWRGSPVAAHLARKLALTTAIALALWVGSEWLIFEDLLSFRHGILASPGL